MARGIDGLDQFSRLLGKHPAAIIEIEVTTVPDEHDLSRWRDPFENLGLIIEEDQDAVEPDHFRLGLHRVDEDQFVVVNAILGQIGFRLGSIASVGDYENLPRPMLGEQLKEEWCFIDATVNIDP